MIENLDEFLVGIAIGVRFRPNFSIEDQLGRVADDLLYKSQSSFGRLFHEVRAAVGGTGKQLFNRSTGDVLTIDNSNFILELGVSPSITVDEIHHLISAYNEEVIHGVMKSCDVRQIHRIGYVCRYIFTIEDLAHRFVNKTIGRSFEGVDDINLAFSKRIPSEAAIAQRYVNDYHNVIFNIIKYADKSEIYMSVDYQKLFDPLLPSVNEIPFGPFIQSAERFNRDNYLPWLNTYYVEG
jgi:hypothetical protein